MLGLCQGFLLNSFASFFSPPLRFSNFVLQELRLFFCKPARSLLLSSFASFFFSLYSCFLCSESGGFHLASQAFSFLLCSLPHCLFFSAATFVFLRSHFRLLLGFQLRFFRPPFSLFNFTGQTTCFLFSTLSRSRLFGKPFRILFCAFACDFLLCKSAFGFLLGPFFGDFFGASLQFFLDALANCVFVSSLKCLSFLDLSELLLLDTFTCVFDFPCESLCFFLGTFPGRFFLDTFASLFFSTKSGFLRTTLCFRDFSSKTISFFLGGQSCSLDLSKSQRFLFSSFASLFLISLLALSFLFSSFVILFFRASSRFFSAELGVLSFAREPLGLFFRLFSR